MAEGFEWWVSQDEERWSPAGATTRGGAIDFGTDEYNGEGFWICEARKGEFDLGIPAFRLIETLELINEERVDSDGDGSLFSRKPTKAEKEALENAVETAIREWFAAHGFATTAWAFAETRNEEYIAEDRLYRPEDRAFYHALVANMGRAW